MTLKTLNLIIKLLDCIKTYKLNLFNLFPSTKTCLIYLLKHLGVYSIFWFIGIKILYRYLLFNVWNSEPDHDVQIKILPKPKKRTFLVLFNLTYVWIRWYVLRNLPTLIHIIKKKLRRKHTYIILKPLFRWEFWTNNR